MTRESGSQKRTRQRQRRSAWGSSCHSQRIAEEMKLKTDDHQLGELDRKDISFAEGVVIEDEEDRMLEKTLPEISMCGCSLQETTDEGKGA